MKCVSAGLAVIGVLCSLSSADVSPKPAGQAEAQVRDMESLATPSQVEQFIKRSTRSFYLFGEDRVNSVRRRDALSAHWLERSADHLERFAGVAQPGEFYVFQLALFAPVQE